MLFNSLQFLIFFPIVIAIYYVVPPKWRYVWLFLTSYYFYMCWNVRYVLLLLFSTVVTYLSGYLLQRITDTDMDERRKTRRRKWCVAGSFFLNLGVLFFFKYFDFAVENINYVLGRLHITVLTPSFDLLLPVGISFYTFQALSYTMDVYRKEVRAERNFIRYALFVSFFPQLVAGPIERSKNLLRQVDEEHRIEEARFVDGVYLMIWGYFLKLVVADRIALYVDRVYGGQEIDTFNGWYIVVATLLFAFQLYCDFAGYSTIAVGAAKMLGFDLMDNFQSPYFSRSIGEFWRRWHISLSSWFRDYLYIPLGGNRKGRARKYFNLLVVFLVSGLWHGAEWTFVIWGLIHAVYQIVGDLTKNIRRRAESALGIRTDSGVWGAVQTVFTFLLWDLSLLFFRADNMAHVRRLAGAVAGNSNPWILFNTGVSDGVIGRKSFTVLMVSLLLLLIVDYCKYKGICIRRIIQKQDFWFRALVLAVSVCVIVTIGVWGPKYTDTNFIYFQF